MTLPFGTGFSPLRGEPVMGTGPIVDTTVTEFEITTGGGARTVTAAELLGGILAIDVEDAQTITLPTGALLNAAIPGVKVGSTIRTLLINCGDTTLTVAVGTGGSLVVSNSKSTVATVVAAASKELIIRVTGVKQAGDTSDSYTVYSRGSTAASVA